MSGFLIDLLNLCLMPFQQTDNLIVFIPVASITVCFLIAIVFRLIRGRY